MDFHPITYHVNDRLHLVILAQVDIAYLTCGFFQCDIEAIIEGEHLYRLPFYNINVTAGKCKFSSTQARIPAGGLAHHPQTKSTKHKPQNQTQART